MFAIGHGVGLPAFGHCLQEALGGVGDGAALTAGYLGAEEIYIRITAGCGCWNYGCQLEPAKALASHQQAYLHHWQKAAGLTQ